MKTPVKVKFKFQIGFLFKVFNATSQQHFFFFLIHCIFGGKKKRECLKFTNQSCSKPSLRGLINLFNRCGQNSASSRWRSVFLSLSCTAENIWSKSGHANRPLTQGSGKVDLVHRVLISSNLKLSEHLSLFYRIPLRRGFLHLK